MAEYIDREALLKRRHGCKNDCSTCDFFLEEDSWCSGEVYVLDILRIPAADVAPVVHGEWVDEGFYADGSAKHAFHCSNCGHHIIEWKDDTSNYCPNCGARMDGET